MKNCVCVWEATFNFSISLGLFATKELAEEAVERDLEDYPERELENYQVFIRGVSGFYG
ncbi:hypothetical protein FK484_0086 [Listeria phage LP-031]|uniref:Uncharacterized protein n=1 Tax=Listeria phage LP-031 TaxID=2590049 RepID=A0A514U7A1_9CAUD|nr:hypothetical protein FK484_0086 [Listeria phage LP-031]